MDERLNHAKITATDYRGITTEWVSPYDTLTLNQTAAVLGVAPKTISGLPDFSLFASRGTPPYPGAATPFVIPVDNVPGIIGALQMRHQVTNGMPDWIASVDPEAATFTIEPERSLFQTVVFEYNPAAG